MRILTIDAACARCSVGLVDGADVVGERATEGLRGHAELPAMVQALGVSGLDLIAVTTGPGSFTGLRAAVALAHGLALGAGVPVIGLTVAEALAEALPQLGDRALWVAIDSRRGQVFLHRDGKIATVAVAQIAPPLGKVAVAGDAARVVAAHLAARGHNVMLTDARIPSVRHIAAVARARAVCARPPIPVLPLYVDPPEAHLPALRPAPR